jgi:hypothetical protein
MFHAEMGTQNEAHLLVRRRLNHEVLETGLEDVAKHE